MNICDSEDGEETGGFLKRNWRAMTGAALALTGGTLAAVKLSSEGGAGTRKAPDSVLMMVQPLPKAVPPLAPPPPREMERIPVEEEKPVAEAPATADSGPGLPPGDSLVDWGIRGGPSRRGASRELRSPVSSWTPYARQAAEKIAEAMRRHTKLKSAVLAIEARVWIDSAGQVTRATIQPTGDSAIDAALQKDVLSGMQLSGPPPAGMVMPVCLKVTARRPD